MKPKSNVVFSLKYIKSEVLNYATLRGGFDRIDENRKKIGVQRRSEGGWPVVCIRESSDA